MCGWLGVGGTELELLAWNWRDGVQAFDLGLRLGRLQPAATGFSPRTRSSITIAHFDLLLWAVFPNSNTLLSPHIYLGNEVKNEAEIPNTLPRINRS